MNEAIIHTIEDLRRYAERFLEHIAPKAEGAVVVGLSGNLGAGKTEFVKQVAAIVGISEDITSPTFVLQKNYPIAWHGFTELIHIDAYRLESGDDMVPLKFTETCINPQHLIFVEWPERIASVLPPHTDTIQFAVQDGERRLLTYKHHDVIH